MTASALITHHTHTQTDSNHAGDCDIYARVPNDPVARCLLRALDMVSGCAVFLLCMMQPMPATTIDERHDQLWQTKLKHSIIVVVVGGGGVSVQCYCVPCDLSFLSRFAIAVSPKSLGNEVNITNNTIPETPAQHCRRWIRKIT